ncbi:MAG: type II toxin-antitoxin system HicA family toxin [Candidatus Polarisedimenticolaceae bacterium]|nr:type II toxin-antitoxin system HicA family toxin [Candidatus Polarisedimenticolaceae bacterium]
MGRLAGFKYRQIIKKLKKLGFEFDRQAAGSHEIWFNPTTNKYTTIPNHPGDMPEGTLKANPQTDRDKNRAVFEDLTTKPHEGGAWVRCSLLELK